MGFGPQVFNEELLNPVEIADPGGHSVISDESLGVRRLIKIGFMLFISGGVLFFSPSEEGVK
jgi:hypothetical protein